MPSEINLLIKYLRKIDGCLMFNSKKEYSAFIKKVFGKDESEKRFVIYRIGLLNIAWRSSDAKQ